MKQKTSRGGSRTALAIIGFLLFSICIYGQKPVYAGMETGLNAEKRPSYKLTPEWKRHKTCQAWGWTALGTGTAMMMYGFWARSMERDDVAKSTSKYVALTYIGVAVTAASVPLFVFSIKNKKKARSLRLGSGSLAYPLPYGSDLTSSPALSIGFDF
ncbi:hypothetical protein [Parabacteroides sp.]